MKSDEVRTDHQAEKMIVEEQQGSSRATENQEKYQETVDKVDKLLAEGHRLMLAKTFDEAANVLGEAVELATDFFGAFAHQSFLPHYNYGKALVEVARFESLPIKAPMENIDDDGGDEDDETEDDDENGMKEAEKSAPEEEQNRKSENENEGKKEEGENGKEKEKTDEKMEEKKEEEEGKADEKKEEEKETEQKTAEEKDQNEEGAKAEEEEEVILEGEDGETAQDDEDGEEGDDAKLAWEILEIARKICEKQLESNENDALWKEHKADVLVALGDCMSVAEEFELALNEFKNALEIRKNLFDPLDRRIAESHYWIGRTHKLLDDFVAAAESFGQSKKILDQLIEVKEKELQEKAEGDTKGCEELAELKEVVKGIEESIQDAIESAEQQRKHLGKLKAMLQPMMQQLSCDSQKTQEVDDITSMVKRKPVKRPLPDETTEDSGEKQTELKKQKQEDNELVAIKGHGKTNGQSDEEQQEGKLAKADVQVEEAVN